MLTDIAKQERRLLVEDGMMIIYPQIQQISL